MGSTPRPRLHVLGAGRAGRVVARWLFDRGRVEIGQVVNQRLASAEQAVGFIGSGQAVADFQGGLDGDLLLLGVPDNKLSGILQARPLRPALVVHLSGAHPADVIGRSELEAASLHPVLPFADSASALTRMDDCRWVSQGSGPALDRLRAIWAVRDTHWSTIARSAKPAYHAAMICASNYLVTLTDMARQLAAQAGLPEASAADLIATLQGATLDNLEGQRAASALTGPIERGDLTTLERVTASLQPGLQARTYAQMGLATLRLADQSRGHNANDAAIEALFLALASGSSTG
ncbi:MAG: DUF2520 domain-containing protein [Wenzhouxiangella sp.]